MDGFEARYADLRDMHEKGATMTALDAVEDGALLRWHHEQEPSGEPRIAERQVWFGPPGRPVFGWLTVPAGATARAGVVLCLPVGEEERTARRTFRRLSRELALRGLLALRFDYDGTGDSAGSLNEPGRVDAWLSSVAAAVELLKSCGVSQVHGVGMRLGATILAGAAGTGSALDVADATATADRLRASPFGSLVLWDPCGSGRDFLREGRALHALGENSQEVVPDGAIDTPGFRFNADTVERMNSLDLGSLPAEVSLADRTLVLLRDDRQLRAKVSGRLRTEPGLEWGVALGQKQMIDRSPTDAIVPLQAIHRIVDWLSVVDFPETHLKLPRTDEVVTVSNLSASDHPGAAAGVGLANGAPVQVLEQARSFGSCGVRGVVTEPIVGPADLPWIVLVNAAVDHYIGPGRLWVNLARELAGQGFPCVRLDQSGVGDSPTRPGQVQDVAFATEWILELQEIADELRAVGRRVVLVGLCSGAYMALETALHTEVDAVVAINPSLRILKTSKGMPLFDPNRRAARPLSKHLARIAVRRARLAGGIWRIYRQFAFWHAPMAVLFAVARRGTDIKMISGPRDSRDYREVLVWSLVRSLKGAWTARVHFDGPSPIDHSVLAQSSQAHVRKTVIRYLSDRYDVRQPVAAPDLSL